MAFKENPKGPSKFKPAIRSLLKRIGLEEREIDVYLALLSLKMAKVSAIARMAKQPRPRTYLLLEQLEKRGFVSRTEKGKILHFLAEDPRKLLGYLEDRHDEISELQTLVDGALPYLYSITQVAMHEPRVTVFQGLDSMKQIYREIFSHEFHAVFNAESMYNTFDRGVIKALLGGNVSLRGKELLVDNAGARRFIKECQQNDEAYEFRVLPRGFDVEADITAYGDTVTLFTFDNEYTIVQIENASLANAFRTLFNFLWPLSTIPNRVKGGEDE